MRDCCIKLMGIITIAAFDFFQIFVSNVNVLAAALSFYVAVVKKMADAYPATIFFVETVSSNFKRIEK